MSSSPTNSWSEPLPVAVLLAERQEHVRLTDDEVAAAIGYANGNVIKQIKAGTLRLPINKVGVLADVLNADPVQLLRSVLNQGSPELLQTLDGILDPLGLTEAERSLIRRLRSVCGDRETRHLVFDGAHVVALVAA